MKKNLVIAAALAVVIVCSGAAVVISNNHKARLQAAQTSEVKSLQAQLQSVQNIQKLHDAANTATVASDGKQIITLSQQKSVLCAQLKTARLVQPLCNQ